MSNVSVPIMDLSVAEVPVTQPGFVGWSSSSVGVVANARGLILKINTGAAATNVTLVGRPGTNSLTFNVAASSTVWMRINNTSDYIQPDGSLHITADQSISSAIAIAQ